MSAFRDWWPPLRTTLTWVALGLCVAFVASERHRVGAAAGLLGVGGIACTATLLLASWWCALQSWRLSVLTFGGGSLSVPDAASQLSLLLVGKYVPGGVWGFAARWAEVADGRASGPMFVAGAFEQWQAMTSLLCLSAALGIAAELSPIFAIPLLPFVPAFVVTSWRLIGVPLIAVLRRRDFFKGDMPIEHARLRDIMVQSAMWSTGTQLFQLAVVAVVARYALDLSWVDGMVVAASYGAAIIVGMLVVLVPGGIGVREAIFVSLVSPWLLGDQAVLLAALLRVCFALLDVSSWFLAVLLGIRSKNHN